MGGAYPGGVGKVGDRLAVGRPHGRALVHALSLREVAGGSVLGRHGEHIAAGDDGHALAVGGEVEALDEPGDIDEGGAGGDGVLGDGDGDGGGGGNVDG